MKDDVDAARGVYLAAFLLIGEDAPAKRVEVCKICMVSQHLRREEGELIP